MLSQQKRKRDRPDRIRSNSSIFFRLRSTRPGANLTSASTSFRLIVQSGDKWRRYPACSRNAVKIAKTIGTMRTCISDHLFGTVSLSAAKTTNPSAAKSHHTLGGGYAPQSQPKLRQRIHHRCCLPSRVSKILRNFGDHPKLSCDSMAG